MTDPSTASVAASPELNAAVQRLGNRLAREHAIYLTAGTVRELLSDALAALQSAPAQEQAMTDAVRDALQWTAAALQVVCRTKRAPSESDWINRDGNVSRTIGAILDGANAALAAKEQAHG